MKKPVTFIEELPKNLFGFQTDQIHFCKDGIIKYYMWSDVFVDWIEIKLEELKLKWPDKFNDVEQELLASFDDRFVQYMKEDEFKDY